VTAGTPTAAIRTGHTTKVIVCSAIVYLVWGSSYLATSIGVHNLPPRLFSGIRFTLGGLLLLALARLLGRRPTLDASELRHTLIVSCCTIVVSNGLNNWAMQWVPSNQTALLNASSALWIAGFGTLGRRAHALSVRVAAGLALGFAGVALVLDPFPSMSGRHAALLVPQLGILAGCIGWSLGTIYFRNVGTRLDLLSFTALQMLFGGIALVLLGVGFGEPARWTWSVRGLAAMGYLTIASSCITYLAYGWLARNVSPAQTGTFGYVNPAIAAVLGWLVLDERLTSGQLLGMAVVLGSVVLVSWPGVRPSRAQAPLRAAPHDEIHAAARTDEPRADPARHAHDERGEQRGPEPTQMEAR
jgi:drug/metabolite transporter (DMT)-like permease